MEWEMQEVDAMTLYREAELVLDKLKLESEYRDEMIAYIFKQLLSDFRVVEDETGTRTTRSKAQAECSAVTVMAIVMISLMNAVDKGHEAEDFDNQPSCVAIMGLLRSHPHFQYLLEDFFRRKKNNSGQKVVFVPADPMRVETTLNNMDDQAKERTEKMLELVKSHTICLKALFGECWEDWEQLCMKVCLNKDLLDKLYEISPRNNKWKMNQKMVCNIIGIFRQKRELNVSINAIDNELSESKVSSYLRNHADYSGSDSELNRLQHECIEKMIE